MTITDRLPAGAGRSLGCQNGRVQPSLAVCPVRRRCQLRRLPARSHPMNGSLVTIKVKVEEHGLPRPPDE